MKYKIMLSCHVTSIREQEVEVEADNLDEAVAIAEELNYSSLPNNWEDTTTEVSDMFIVDITGPEDDGV